MIGYYFEDLLPLGSMSMAIERREGSNGDLTKLPLSCLTLWLLFQLP